MDFASAYILEEEEEEESDDEESRGHGAVQFEAELCQDSGDEDEYQGGYECEIMEFDEEEDFPLKKKKKKNGSSLNTVNLKLQVLKDDPPEQIMQEKLRYTCGNKRVCGAVLSQIDQPVVRPDSEEKIWQCRFCGYERTIKEWPEFKDCPNGDILFVQDVDSRPDMTLDPGENMVIFVLDCSGSMAHPLEKQGFMMPMMQQMGIGGGGGGMMKWMSAMMGGHNQQYQEMQQPQGPTRLQALRDGVVEEIKKLKTNAPKTKVGVVYFTNEVTIVGDGSQKAVTLSGSTLDDYNKLLTTGQRQPSLGYVEQSCDKLVKALNKLNEGGQTALGPALVVAMAMAAKNKTSKVVLCTDGYANIGLGAIQGGLSRNTTEFYQDVTTHCKNNGVSVSLISFDECGFAQALGELPLETGGLLWRVTPGKKDLKIDDVLTRKTMATDAFVKFVVNKQLYVENAMDKEEERSNYTHLVGNIHTDMSHAFKFGFRRDEASKKQREDLKKQGDLFDEKPVEDADGAKIVDITDALTNKVFGYTDDTKSEDEDNEEGDDDNKVVATIDPKTAALAELNKESVPFQVQIYYVDLNGVEGTRIWTSLKPITADKQQAEQASNLDTLITNLVQTASKKLMEIYNGKHLDGNLNSEARQLRDTAKKMLEDPKITDGESNALNDFITLVSKISTTSHINDEIAEKLRNYQASGVNTTTPIPV